MLFLASTVGSYCMPHDFQPTTCWTELGAAGKCTTPSDKIISHFPQCIQEEGVIQVASVDARCFGLLSLRSIFLYCRFQQYRAERR